MFTNFTSIFQMATKLIKQYYLVVLYPFLLGKKSISLYMYFLDTSYKNFFLTHKLHVHTC